MRVLASLPKHKAINSKLKIGPIFLSCNSSPSWPSAGGGGGGGEFWEFVKEKKGDDSLNLDK